MGLCMLSRRSVVLGGLALSLEPGHVLAQSPLAQPPLTQASPEEDIAPVVLFLASKDAQFLTGYSLTPDGGSIIDSAR